MSYIDLFKHEDLGVLLDHIEVYYTKQDINGDEFVAKNNQFIIGGGSGEHSAAVCESTEFVVAWYLSEVLDSIDENHKLHDKFDSIMYETNEKGMICGTGKYNCFNVFTFYDWTLSEYGRLYKLRESLTDGECEESTENWLCSELGKFIVGLSKEYNPLYEETQEVLTLLKG